MEETTSQELGQRSKKDQLMLHLCRVKARLGLWFCWWRHGRASRQCAKFKAVHKSHLQGAWDATDICVEAGRGGGGGQAIVQQSNSDVKAG